MTMKVGMPLSLLFGEVEWLHNYEPTVSEGTTPVFIHFWAISCPACKANMPDVQVLRDEFPNIRFIAIHSPRLPDDTDIVKVQRIADEIGITEPCAIDNQHLLADRFELGGIWPYYYIFDAEGKLRRRGAGGMGLRLLTSVFAELRSMTSSI